MSTLTEAEREALACVATGHEPLLCDCNDAYRDPGDRFCEYARETFAAVERILAARLADQREQIARDWQMGGWMILTDPVREGVPSLALGQRVTDWLRAWEAAR